MGHAVGLLYCCLFGLLCGYSVGGSVVGLSLDQLLATRRYKYCLVDLLYGRGCLVGEGAI